MAFDISPYIEEAYDTLVRLLKATGQEAWDHTLGLVNPIVADTIEVTGIVIVCFVISWWFPPVRSFFGAVAIGAVTWLAGVFRGERIEKEYLSKHPPRRK